jgi:hypothetical protein
MVDEAPASTATPRSAWWKPPSTTIGRAPSALGSHRGDGSPAQGLFTELIHSPNSPVVLSVGGVDGNCDELTARELDESACVSEPGAGCFKHETATATRSPTQVSRIATRALRRGALGEKFITLTVSPPQRTKFQLRGASIGDRQAYDATRRATKEATCFQQSSGRVCRSRWGPSISAITASGRSS